MWTRSVKAAETREKAHLGLLQPARSPANFLLYPECPISMKVVVGRPRQTPCFAGFLSHCAEHPEEASEVKSMSRSTYHRRSPMRPRLALVLASSVAVCGLLLTVQPSVAQFGGGGGGNTIGSGPTSGVAVDAEGVLTRTTVQDPTGELARQRVQEALGRLDKEVARRSPLRKVSLTRLERVMRERLAAGQEIDETMQYLAGLTRVEYVFCYPETGDVVIAGPAEAWGEAPSGRILGIETGRPVLELQDLIVALRAFPPGASRSTPFIYCSIDPTPEGLARMQEFLQQFGGQHASLNTQFIVEQLRNRLGMQVITVGGISPKTHFALVLVEADYRMKLIGIGLERPPVRLASYVDRARPGTGSRNALQRWYFVPDYQCVRVSEDALAMELVGEGVRLVGEDEVVSADGRRARANRPNRASEAFVRAFTKVYPRLADRAPVYAQLRNCIDLAVAAAFIQQQDYYEAVGWKPDVFASERMYPVETYNPPQQVASAVNSIWKGRTLMTPIGGGVQMRPTEAIDPTNLLDDEQRAVEQARTAIDLSGLAPNEWWWD